MPTLQHRHNWLLNKRNLVVNELILIVDTSVPGQDAFVRTADVKTKNSMLVRPVTKSCLLEEGS